MAVWSVGGGQLSVVSGRWSVGETERDRLNRVQYEDCRRYFGTEEPCWSTRYALPGVANLAASRRSKPGKGVEVRFSADDISGFGMFRQLPGGMCFRHAMVADGRPPRCFSNGWCMNTGARVEYHHQTNRVSEINSGPDNLSTMVAIASARRTWGFAESRRTILVSRGAPRTRTRGAVAPNDRSQRIATALGSTGG
jgi:hypothetical protein